MSTMIKRIDYFPAGYCSSHSGLLFKGIPNEKMQFPASVFLIHHREKGYILYDTGYLALAKQELKHLFAECPDNSILQEYSERIDSELGLK